MRVHLLTNKTECGPCDSRVLFKNDVSSLKLGDDASSPAIASWLAIEGRRGPTAQTERLVSANHSFMAVIACGSYASADVRIIPSHASKESKKDIHICPTIPWIKCYGLLLSMDQRKYRDCTASTLTSCESNSQWYIFGNPGI